PSFLFTLLPGLRSPLFPYTTLFRSWVHRMPEPLARPGIVGRHRLLKPIFHLGMHKDPTAGNHGGAVPFAHGAAPQHERRIFPGRDRKSTRLNSSHVAISYAVFCLKK